MSQSIIILGAGFGGLAAAKKLRKGIRSGACTVTLIDRESYHVFTPLLYEISTAITRTQSISISQNLARAGSMRVDDIVRPWGVDFVQADVRGIDWETKQVLCNNRALRFDQLVIALGSETNFFGIDGMADCAYTLKSLRDAERIRQRLEDLIAIHKKTGHAIHIMIGGAVATGVELAAEMAMFFRRKMISGDVRSEDFSLSLVEAQSRLLPMFHPQFSAWAHEQLTALGVTVHLDTCIKHLSRREVTLAPRPLKQDETRDMLVCDFRALSEKHFESDMTIWTGGVRGSSSLERLGLPLDPRGKRIIIDAWCRVADHNDVYVIGDSALFINPKTQQPIPWLAQTAIEQGKLVAKNLLSLGQRFSISPCLHYSTIVPLGGKFVAVDLGWFRFRGFLAWLVRGLVDFSYFFGIRPCIKATRMWLKGIRLYSRND